MTAEYAEFLKQMASVLVAMGVILTLLLRMRANKTKLEEYMTTREASMHARFKVMDEKIDKCEDEKATSLQRITELESENRELGNSIQQLIGRNAQLNDLLIGFLRK